MLQTLYNCLINLSVDQFLIRKTYFHLGRMHIDIHIRAFDLNMKTGKRIFMLHHKRMISIFHCFCHDLTLYISSIDIIIFKITVSPGNYRFPDKSIDSDRLFPVFCMDLNQFPGNISPVDLINRFFQIIISGSMQFRLTVLHIFERNMRMRQCQLFNKTADITGFCSRCL